MFDRALFRFVPLLLLAGQASAAQSPLDSVDPFIGVRGAGSCVPGPCLPNASIHPSPDTEPPDNGGYLSGEPSKIVGFSQLHVQGTGGTKSYGNFLLTPQIGSGPAKAFPASEEKAFASHYQVRLAQSEGKSLFCEVAPTSHSAIYRFTFPKSGEATLLIDVGRKLDLDSALVKGSIKINPDTGVITGGGRFENNWNPAPYDLYFALETSKPPKNVGTWVGDKRNAGTTDAKIDSAAPLGGFLQWSTEERETLTVKIAVSFHSVAQAEKFLRQEIPGWDYSAVVKSAQEQWDKKLSLIALEGASPEEQKKFYTALYHAQVQPRYRTGEFAAYDPSIPLLDDQYTLWDSWRTEYPLMAIIRPELLADTVNAFLERHEKNQRVGAAFIQGREMHTGQGGEEADIIVADAFVKGIPGVDWQKAYSFIKSNADKGRTPEYRERGYCSLDTLAESRKLYDKRFCPASATLAFAYSDFCVAQVAKGLGKTQDAQVYLARSGNWKNVWDNKMVDGAYTGFIHNRNANGAFADKMGKVAASPRAGRNTDFYEGTPWIYSFAVPHDFEALVEKMGGRERYIQRLQFAMDNDLIDFGNEPSFLTLCEFSAAGRPDLMSLYAHKLRERFTLQAYPGDEDNGAMSSFYIFLTSGFMPLAGQDVYYLFGSTLPKITFQVGEGKSFTVISTNPGSKNIYVQSAKLNGQPLSKPLLNHSAIKAGGTLEFVMGNTPSSWGQN